MEIEEHKGDALPFVTIRPDGYDSAHKYPLIILLHGFGATMYDLAGLAPAISETGYVYACPNAPVAMDIGGGQVGFGWTPPDGFNDPEWAQRSEDLLDRSIAEMFGATDANPGITVLLGFSQGGGLAYRYGLIRPDVFAGVVALSTGFPRADGFDQTLPLQRFQPIFIGHGTQDPVVPVESGRTAKTHLVELGYAPEHHEYPIGHEISDEEIRDLATWLKGVLPPFGAPLSS
ncbi:MAG: alpha/beta fold hydrolase [Dehalococcoidia bacterium]|nr:alpha/beta fold hydrolase [Dehalococcoidia bacterium]